METGTRGWCGTCSTQHKLASACPGDLPVTGAEKRGLRLSVQTPDGPETFVVVLAPSDKLWRARILTHPNVPWLVPGSRLTMKFVGNSPTEAERKAARLIREICRQRGFRLDGEAADAVPASGASTVPPTHAVQKEPAPRKVRFLPVRFGVVSASESAATGNLSETGLFIITEAPLDASTPVTIKLNVGGRALAMKGQVRWSCRHHPTSGTPGMGVRLLAPPETYTDYVGALE